MTRRKRPELGSADPEGAGGQGETGDKVVRLVLRPAEGGKGRAGRDRSASPMCGKGKVPSVESDLKSGATLVVEKTSVAVAGPSVRADPSPNPA